MMVMMLRKLGYELCLAANGRDALALLEREAKRGREHEIQAILMDCSMTPIDGMECQKLYQHNTHAKHDRGKRDLQPDQPNAPDCKQIDSHRMF